MKILFFRKSMTPVSPVHKDKTEKDKLDFFKRGILRHLRSLNDFDEPDEVKKAYAPGTIRTWKGEKYIKGADKKWRRYYDSAGRGAQTSIKYLMKKVDAVQSVEALLQLVLLHRDRFVDGNGNQIPIVQELSRYVNEKQGKINATQAAKPAPASNKIDRSKLKTGDYYVAESDDISGGKGKYVVRTVRENGNDSYVSAIGPQLGIGGIITFDTKEEAQKWIDDNPVKTKNRELPQETKDFIDQNKGSKPDAKGYLYNKKGDGRILLSGAALDYYNSVNESESEKHKNRSDAMKGNQNAKKDGVAQDIAASRQMRTEQKEEKQARKKAGMPPTELFDRSSAMDDSTWDPKSKNYRYKDTGYIAGSRKENAANYIRHQARNGTHVSATDIDWQGIEENPRQARLLITKSNIFGKVDWDSLKGNGMNGGAGFLIDRVYASVGAEPKEDNADARHDYSIAIDGLRDRLEKCKTIEEVTTAIREIRAEMNGDYVSARNAPEVLRLGEQITVLVEKREEMKKKVNVIWNTNTELDKKAEEFRNAEEQKVRQKDKRKKRVLLYDLPQEAVKEYERLQEASRDEKYERFVQFYKDNGFFKNEEEYKDEELRKKVMWKREWYEDEITALTNQRKELYLRKAAEIIMSNPLHAAWTQLGDKFQGVMNYGHYKGSDTFHSHVSDARRGKYDNWEWATKDLKGSTKGQKRKAEFELKVASRLERKGGRNVKSQTTLELKNNFNLRDVQSGNWVLNDPESAKFHVDNITAGLSDLCDMTGIPDNMVAMNGRLAIAIGARGTGSAGWKKSAAAAHYEPVERVINLTKMKGGGCLAHEWFHAFDNLISEAMTGGDINQFLTDPYTGLSSKQRKLKEKADYWIEQYKATGKPQYSYFANEAIKAAEEAGVTFPKPGSEEEHILKVKAAFNNLVKAMTEGKAPLLSKVTYNNEDYRKAMINLGEKGGSFGKSLSAAGSLDAAIGIINKRNFSNKKEWIKMTVAWYDKNPDGNTVMAPSGEQGSSFLKEAQRLDSGGGKEYFSAHKEMAARAFSAFVDDKLRKNERLNDYLAYATTNDFYEDPIWGNSYPYPEGEERERINNAFDELFKVVNETGAIRKAIEMENTRIVLKKTMSTKALADDDKKLAYFKKQILACLNEDDTVDLEENDGVKKAGYPVGTIRTWKGQEYVKVAPGKWRPKYNTQTRGARMAIAAIKRKVDAASTAKELMDIVMLNRDRFSDKEGHPLPFVQELSKYVAEKQEYLPENIKAKRKEARSNAIKEGQRKAREKKEEAKKAAEENKRQKAEKMKKQEESAAGKNNKYGVSEEIYNTAIKPYLDGDISLNSLKRKLENAGLSKNKVGRLANSLWEETHPDPEAETAKKQAEDYRNIPYEERKKMAEEAIKKQDEMLGNTDSQDDIDFQAIKDKYQGGKSIEGGEDEIYVGDEALKGKWKLVEADSPSASHDEETFHKTRGFPKNKDGSTINDRDYSKDRAAQETVMSMASNFDGRAFSFDSPVVVTQDGIVVSGNNRTMSSKLAARKGTDTRYVDALRKRAERFGFKAGDIDGFKHPRVVFQIDGEGEYSTRDFAKYNQESQKTMSPLESAVKVSKIITEQTVKDIAVHISEFETMGELYADKKACTTIFNSLQTGKIINEFSRNTYIDPDGFITGAGKEFLETVLIGSVVNEQNIRALNREGCKHIRAKLVRAITPLVNNKSLGGYSIMDELNQAIDISVQFNIAKDKFGTLDDLVTQGSMFEQMSSVAVELARKLQMNQKDFAEFMQSMNASLEIGASGQSDIFLGDVETKDDVLARVLSIKKAIRNVINFFKKSGPKNNDTVDLLNTEQKIIAVDFDGVINSYKGGWKGPTVTDDPVLSAIESINTLSDQGYKIIIYSTRAQTGEGLDTIREYLLKHSGNPAMVEGIEITDKKPIAHVYIDDRAITFNGDWKETLKQIEEFKPWMEKSLTWSG